MLTKNLRTHILELTKDREIPITQEQYKAIKNMQRLEKYTDPLEIRDADTGKMLHDWLMRDIIWFREVERSEYIGSQFVCDFWIRHPINDPCDCSEKYWMSPIVFRTALYSLYPNVTNAKQITPEMRNKILSSLSKNDSP